MSEQQNMEPQLTDAELLTVCALVFIPLLTIAGGIIYGCYELANYAVHQLAAMV